MNVYDALRGDFENLAELITERERHGLVERSGAPFSHSLKKLWLRDAENELGDALTFFRAERFNLAERMRFDADAKHSYLEVGECERKTAEVIQMMMVLDGRMPPRFTKRRELKWR